MKLLMPRATCALAMGLALSACRPETPPVDKPVEPQVGTLADAVQEPRERIAFLEKRQVEAAGRQMAAVEAAAI